MPPRGFNPYQQGQYQGASPYQRNQRQNPYQQNRQQMPQYQMNPYILNNYQQQQMLMQQQQMPMHQQQQMPMHQQQQMPTQQQQIPTQQSQDPMVSYEPIDEKTLNEIRASLGEPKQEPVSDKAVTVYAVDKKIVEIIGDFAQNEKNASIFYRNLSELSHNNAQRKILSKISETSKKHIEAYQGIYKNFSGKNHEIRDVEIISSSDFYDGVRFALIEETALLEELNDLYDGIPDERCLKTLNKMINRKISVINYLRNLQI